MFEKKEHQNSGTLGKDTINNWIITFLSVKRRFSFNNGEQPDVYFLDVTWIGMLLLGFISKFLKYHCFPLLTSETKNLLETLLYLSLLLMV